MYSTADDTELRIARGVSIFANAHVQQIKIHSTMWEV